MVSSKVFPLKSVKYFPTNPSNVKVYYKNDTIPYKYVEFAEITIKVPRKMKEDKLQEKCKEVASKIGADGIIFEDRENKGVNYWWLTRQSTIKAGAIKKIMDKK